MSDQIYDKDSGDDAQWRPLIPGQLEKVDEEEVVPSGPKKKKVSDFKKMYEHSTDDGASGEFTLIFTREEEKNAIDRVKSDITETLKQEPEKPGKKEAPEKNEIKAAPVPEPPEVDPKTIERIEKEAYEKGFSQGEKDGFESGKNEASQMVANMDGILSEIRDLWRNMVKKYEKEILDLVCHAVEKVVYGQIAVDNDLVKKAILHAFEKIPHPVDVTININPDDYEYIEETKEEILDQVKGLKHVVVVANPAVNRGGCRVETSSGEVDTSVFDRLEAIKKSIVEAGGV